MKLILISKAISRSELFFCGNKAIFDNDEKWDGGLVFSISQGS
jgi:hypothetical protein